MATVSSSGSSTSSTSSFSNKYSSNKLTGMFSNLDTDSLVQSMTSGQQAKIDKVKQRETREGWLEDAWTSVQDTVNTFQNTYASVTGSSSMLKTSTYYNYKVNSDSTSNAVSLSASSTTAVGDYTVEVDQLAQNASVTSQNISASGTSAISTSNTATLGSLKFANGLKFNNSGNISFSINGKAFTFSSGTTLQNMLNTVNNDTTANVTMKYSRLTNGFTLTSDSGGAASSITIKNIAGNAFGSNSAFGIAEGTVSKSSASVASSGISSSGSTITDTSKTLANLSLANTLTFDSSNNVSFAINGKTFTFAKTTALQDMLDTVNNDATANVTMSYNSGTDGFTIKSDSSSGGSVTIKNISGNAFGNGSAFGISEGTTKSGTDAVAVINGTTITQDSNDFTIDNVTYSLKSVTKGTSDEAINFSVQRDYSATTSAVKTFADAFNTMITSLTSLVNEKDYSADYPPLTEKQESSMTTDQITAWNKKAKSGLLRHNTELENFISNLKNSFYSSLGGTGKNATAIGISTAGYFDSNAGQLTVDTDALQSALENNPDQVVSMFTNGSSTSSSSTQGLMYKLKSVMSNYNDTLKTSISTAATKITSYASDATDLQDKLDDLANRYYAKFSKMETALSKLNTQSSAISQMFSSSSG